MGGVRYVRCVKNRELEFLTAQKRTNSIIGLFCRRRTNDDVRNNTGCTNGKWASDVRHESGAAQPYFRYRGEYLEFINNDQTCLALMRVGSMFACSSVDRDRYDQPVAKLSAKG